MSTPHIELINLSNAVHNGAKIPDGWILHPKWLDPQVRLDFDTSPITTEVYYNPTTKKTTLAIKGTDGEMADWFQVNPAFPLGTYPKAIETLVKMAYEINLDNVDDKNNVFVTGFSQGGGLAELLSHTFTALWAFKRCGRRVRLWLTNDQNAFYGWNDGVFY